MKISRVTSPLIAIGLGLLGAVGIVLAAGESPLVLFEAFHNTFFTSYGLGYSLFYTTPLIFTGLSVALAFHCGLFNIGAEGQLYIGSLGVIAVAALGGGISPWIALPLAILAAATAGGAYGALAGALKAYRGSHEVIVTILLNFIAVGIVDYCILNLYKNQETQTAETFVVSPNWEMFPLSAVFKTFGLTWLDTTPVNGTFLLALLCAGLVYYLLFRTTAGFELRTVGKSGLAARFAGISVARNMIVAFGLAGALAGLVGVNEVLGHQHRLIQGFSPQYGFTGIAVAMLARNNPLGIIVTAFLFGSFHNAARELEFASDRISKELAFVIQAVMIAIVASEGYWGRLLKRRVKHA